MSHGPLTISISESGSLQSKEQSIIKSEVSQRTAILWLIEEGTLVEKGDKLIELNSTFLKDELIRQQITVNNGEAALIQAKENLTVEKSKTESDISKAELDLRFAETDLTKYLEGEYPLQLKEQQSKISIAEEELKRAQDTFNWSEKLEAKGYITRSELQADELAATRMANNLEIAQAKLHLLKTYTHKQQVDKLTSDVQQKKAALIRTRARSTSDIIRAESQVQARQSEFDRQNKTMKKLEEEIEKCTITAPTAGMAIYATSVRRNWRRPNPMAVGDEVHEREELIYLPARSGYTANVKIHEANIQDISKNMSARITVDALPGSNFNGTVSSIAPLPDQHSSWMNPDLKVFNTSIDLDENSDKLRTGMGCQVEIVIETFTNTIAVPLQCLVLVDGTPTVYRDNGTQEGEAISVVTGPRNNRMIAVTAGLREGDIILLAPPLSESEAPDPEQGDNEKDTTEDVQ